MQGVCLCLSYAAARVGGGLDGSGGGIAQSEIWESWSWLGFPGPGKEAGAMGFSDSQTPKHHWEWWERREWSWGPMGWGQCLARGWQKRGALACPVSDCL